MPDQQIVYVDMDDVLCDYSGAHDNATRSQPDIAYPQSIAGFFKGLVPISGAIEAVNKLRKRFDLFVLSAPSTRNPLCYTEKRIWIENHFDYAFTKKLILSPDKGLFRGQFLIDDHTSGRGQERFDGELIHFGSPRFPDWNSVLEYLAE
jgi:5'(3')-deoxyribonucleotidase